MTTAWTLARVSLPNINGNPRDGVTNDFVFEDGDFTAADDAFEDFYNDTVTHQPVCKYLSSVLSRASNAASISYFDITGHLDGSAHGSAIRVHTFTLGAGFSVDDIANEVCIVGSLHGDYTGIPEVGSSAAIPTPEAAQDMGAPATHTGFLKPKSRYRGRVYIGPLNEGVDGVSTTGFSVVGTNAIDDVKGALSRLRSDFLAMTPEGRLAVWSRRGETTHPVVGGWVSNDYGIQRRRGNKSPTKTTWT